MPVTLHHHILVLGHWKKKALLSFSSEQMARFFNYLDFFSKNHPVETEKEGHVMGPGCAPSSENIGL